MAFYYWGVLIICTHKLLCGVHGFLGSWENNLAYVTGWYTTYMEICFLSPYCTIVLASPLIFIDRDGGYCSITAIFCNDTYSDLLQN